MKERAILVVDYGTSNVHANVISAENGNILFSQSKKYKMLSPHDGYTEIGVGSLWDNSVECVSAVMSRCADRVRIAALCFSYFGDNLIPVDEERRPLMNCILSFDVRGEREGAFINASLGAKKVIELIGNQYGWSATGAKILWLRNNMPEVFKKAKYFYTQQQYINNKLGLEALNDVTMACRKSLYDIKNRRWSPELLKLIGISEEQLGKVVDTDTVIGSITSYGSFDFGYPVPVVIGGHDCDCGMVGMGICDETTDFIADITGTYDHLGFIHRGYKNLQELNPLSGMISYCGPIANTMSCIGAFPTSGALLEWFMREINGDTSSEAYKRMWSDAVFDGSNSVEVIPTFSSNSGKITGLDLTKTKTDIFEGIIEALTFETRKIADQCNMVKNKSVAAVRVGGGAANSGEWLQLRADVMGVPFVKMENIEVSSLGAAIIAAVSIGFYRTLREAFERTVRTEREFVPRREVFERYEQKYRSYVARLF